MIVVSSSNAHSFIRFDGLCWEPSVRESGASHPPLNNMITSPNYARFLRCSNDGAVIRDCDLGMYATAHNRT